MKICKHVDIQNHKMETKMVSQKRLAGYENAFD